MDNDRLSLRELQVAANSLGAKRTEKALEILSDNEIFIQAWKTNVGKELLGYLTDRYGAILGEIAKEEDAVRSTTLRCELRVISGLVNEVARKVNAYVGTIDRVRNKISREV